MTHASGKPTHQRYFVLSVERSDPPSNDYEGEWYRYVIGGGLSEITGIRSGSYQSVAQYAEEFAEHINERSLLGFSGYPTLKLTSGTKNKTAT